jgi:nitrate/nitrite-specific signal transduction histidine kinase
VITSQKQRISLVVVQTAVIGVTILILVILITYFLTKSITRPVIKLRDTAILIGKGKLDTKIEIKSKDEIGQLAQVFNEMAGKLKESYGNLEQKVVERTKEVEAAKTELSQKLDEMSRMNKLMVDRELKMIELKKEIEALKKT